MIHHKRMTAKVLHPGNKKCEKKTIVAPPGRSFNDEGEEMFLNDIAAMIEKHFPDEEYKMVMIGPGQFNFVHTGKKPAPVAETEAVLQESA